MAIKLGDAVLKVGIDKTQLDKGLSDLDKSFKSHFEKMGAEARAAGQVNEQAAKNFEAGWKKAMAPLKGVGIAMTAVGALGSKMAADVRQWNTALSMTGITMGKTTAEMRGLVLSITDVGLSIDECISSFEILARAGVRDATEMTNATKAFDALGHAVGMSADAVAEMMIPALRALGEDIPQSAEDLDAFTYLVKNTTVDLGDMASVMNYVAIQGDKLTVTTEDMVAILGVLSQRGLQGSAATRRLRTATSEAAETGKDLNEVLGITNAELDAYKQKINGATGITEKYAKAAEKQYGIMDKLKQAWHELSLRLAPVLSFMEPVFNLFVALGPMLVVVALKVGLVRGAMIALKAAMSFLTSAWGIFGLGVAAVGAAIGWVMNRFSGAGVDIDKMNASLDTAKTQLQAMEEAGYGASDSADALRNRINLLSDTIAKFENKLKDNVITQNNLTDAIKKYQDGLAELEAIPTETAEALMGASGILGKFATAELGGMASDVEELSSSFVDLVKSSEDLGPAWNAAVKSGEELLQLIVIQEQQTRDVAAATKVYDDALKDINDTYGQSAASTAKTLVDIARDQSDALRDSLNEQKKAIQDAARDAIDSARRVHDARCKLLDDETNSTVKALQDQIDALDTADKVSAQVVKDKQRKDKETELRAKIAGAWNRKDREVAEKELADFLTQTAQEVAEEQRQAQRDSLEQQIADVQQAAEETKNQYDEELRAFEEAKNAETESQQASIDAQISGLAAALETKLAMIETDRLAAIKAQADILAAVQNRVAAETAMILNAQSLLSTSQLPGAGGLTTQGLIDMLSGMEYENAMAAGYGMAGGGIIREPSILTSVATGRPYATVGERGPETVTPGVGGITIHVAQLHVREEADVHRIAAELLRLRQLKGSYGAS